MPKQVLAVLRLTTGELQSVLIVVNMNVIHPRASIKTVSSNATLITGETKDNA
jgi:hypothetical protein